MQHKTIDSFAVFDSYLAKLIVENPQHFRPMLDKINRFLIYYLNEDQEERVQRFYDMSNDAKMTNKDHVLYLLKNTPQTYVLDQKLEYFFMHPEQLNASFSQDFTVFNLLHVYKFFFENVPVNLEITNAWLDRDNQEKKSKVPSLFSLSAKKIVEDDSLVKKLCETIRSSDLFSKENRGRVSKGSVPIKTTDLGIIDPNKTPLELQNYFPLGVFAARNEYKEDEISVAPFLDLARKLDLPFVAGASGTASLLVPPIIIQALLNPHELRYFFTFLAGCVVAEGHHSFLEVMVVAQKSGMNMKLRADDTALDIYNSFLPEKIKNTSEYKELCASVEILLLNKGLKKTNLKLHKNK